MQGWVMRRSCIVDIALLQSRGHRRERLSSARRHSARARAGGRRVIGSTRLPATGAPSRQQTAENLTYSGTPGHAGGFRRSRNSDESVTRANKLKTEAGSGQAGTLPFAVAAPHIWNIHCQLTSLRQARCPPSVDR